MSEAIPRHSVIRLGYAQGATPAKWAKIWRDRFPDITLELVPLHEGATPEDIRESPVEISLIRDSSPMGSELSSDWHSIALYQESLVVLIDKTHPYTESVSLPLLNLRQIGPVIIAASAMAWLPEFDTVRSSSAYTTADVAATVATGAVAGITVGPIARAVNQRDIIAIPIDGIDGPWMRALWQTDDDDEIIQELVGVMRGRRTTSSRGKPGITSNLPPEKQGKDKKRKSTNNRDPHTKQPGKTPSRNRRRTPRRPGK